MAVDIIRSSYYVHAWSEEISFSRFMCHSTMGVTRCYKMHHCNSQTS